MKKENVKHILQLEGLIIALMSIFFYLELGGDVIFFIILWLVPDMGMIGYIISKKIGSLTYNITHTYTIPIILLSYTLLSNLGLGVQVSLIWISHIGLDRFLGYGIKYPDKFKNTHMNKI